MAKAGDGRILVELTANGCGECERQEALVIPSTSFYHFTKDKVPCGSGSPRQRDRESPSGSGSPSRRPG